MANNSPQSSQRSDKSPGVSIPIQVRVGGAFMALAAVLFLLALVAVFTDGWGAPFEWTPIRVAIIIAALLVGGFATVRKDQKASVAQVVALAVAVLFIFGGRFLPQDVYLVQHQSFLVLYGGAALLCALILRRSVMPKA